MTSAKRDLVAATREQKEKFQKTNKPEKKKKKKAIIESTSELEITENRTGKKKKQKKTKPRLRAEFEIDNEEEVRPPVIDLTSSISTEEESNKNKGEEQKSTPDEKMEIVQNPEKVSCPIKTTAKWEEKPPEAAKRSSETVRIPRKRYGIDLIQGNKEPED